LISFFIFLVFFTIYLSKDNVNWWVLLISAIFTLIFASIVCNLYLTIQYVIEYLEKGSITTGTIISYFCLNLVSINIMIYLTLFTLKMEGIISYNFSFISIPIYIIFVIITFFIIFILPALIKKKALFFEAIISISYINNLFALIIILNHRFDNNKKGPLALSIIPLYIALFIHLIYNIYYYIYHVWLKKENFFTYFSSSLILIIVAIDSILVCLKVDQKKEIENWLLGLLLIIAFNLYAVDIIYSNFWIEEKEETEEKEQLNNNV